MRQIGNDEYSEAQIQEIPRQQRADLMDTTGQSSSMHRVAAPPYPTLVRASLAPALVAVVDESGYLVPVCTAADLLRICKNVWRAS